MYPVYLARVFDARGGLINSACGQHLSVAIFCRWGVVGGAFFVCLALDVVGRLVVSPGLEARRLARRAPRPSGEGLAWPSGVMSSRPQCADAAGAAGASARSARVRLFGWWKWLRYWLSRRVSRLAARGSHLEQRGKSSWPSRGRVLEQRGKSSWPSRGRVLDDRGHRWGVPGGKGPDGSQRRAAASSSTWSTSSAPSRALMKASQYSM